MGRQPVRRKGDSCFLRVTATSSTLDDPPFLRATLTIVGYEPFRGVQNLHVSKGCTRYRGCLGAPSSGSPPPKRGGNPQGRLRIVRDAFDLLSSSSCNFVGAKSNTFANFIKVRLDNFATHLPLGRAVSDGCRPGEACNRQPFFPAKASTRFRQSSSSRKGLREEVAAQYRHLPPEIKAPSIAYTEAALQKVVLRALRRHRHMPPLFKKKGAGARSPRPGFLPRGKE